MAALQILIGDYDGAKDTLTDFFNGIFQDQVAQSGEQPFESIRSRPFHYRCFNLEALIVNLKLGDQLGLNFWTAKSKYGATVQTAIDYTMRVDPKNEDPKELVPHVLLAIAAYGDPGGKYLNWVKRVMPEYDGKIYHIYNQIDAFVTTPVVRRQEAAAAKRGQTTPAPSQRNHQKREEEENPLFGLTEIFLQPFPYPAVRALSVHSVNDTTALAPSPSSPAPIATANATTTTEPDPPSTDTKLRAISDWQSLRTFTWLAPPVRFAKRLAEQAAALWIGGPEKAPPSRQEKQAGGGAGMPKDEDEDAPQLEMEKSGEEGERTLGGRYNDVLRMREENGHWTD
jgi:hypothetical protein